jgi:hypothetical protein
MGGRNANNVLLHVRHQMMSVEQGQPKWMKPEQSNQRVFWSHRHMDEDVPIEAVKEE